MVPADVSLPLIAVIDGEPAIVAFLEEALAQEGLQVVGLSLLPHLPLEAQMTAFLRQHAPRLVLLDIPPPYRGSWPLLQTVRRAVPNAGIVVLTTDPYAVAKLVGNNGTLKVIGKPFELDEMLSAVRGCLAAT